MTLPDLKGSPKQIDWAETLRGDAIETAERHLAENSIRLDELLADQEVDPVVVERVRDIGGYLTDALLAAPTVTSAKWWIENRRRSLQDWVRAGKLKARTPAETDAGFLPYGENSLTLPASEVAEWYDRSVRFMLPHSQWEGCTFTHPLSMTEVAEDGAVTLLIPGTWDTTISDGAHRETITAAALFLDRTNRLDVPADPYVIANLFRYADWNDFPVSTSDVVIDGATATVTLVKSQWEGLHFQHPTNLLTENGDGTTRVRFGPEWDFKVRGGERVTPVPRKDLWDDRMTPQTERGPSLAVHQKQWSQVVFHPSRVKAVKGPKSGKSKSVMVFFPWDSDRPGAVVFHPIAMTSREVMDDYDPETGERERVTVRRTDVWRWHDEWVFTIKNTDDTEDTLTGAEFLTAIEDWAETDGANDIREFTPVLLAPVTNLTIPEELRLLEAA